MTSMAVSWTRTVKTAVVISTPKTRSKSSVRARSRIRTKSLKRIKGTLHYTLSIERGRNYPCEESHHGKFDDSIDLCSDVDMKSLRDSPASMTAINGFISPYSRPSPFKIVKVHEDTLSHLNMLSTCKETTFEEKRRPSHSNLPNAFEYRHSRRGFCKMGILGLVSTKPSNYHR